MRPNLVRRIHETNCDLVGVWMEGDGSVPPDYSWYEAELNAWYLLNGVVVPFRVYAQTPTIGESLGRGWLARGCAFDGSDRGPWVLVGRPYRPYRTRDDAVSAAMAEYEE